MTNCQIVQCFAIIASVVGLFSLSGEASGLPKKINLEDVFRQYENDDIYASQNQKNLQSPEEIYSGDVVIPNRMTRYLEENDVICEVEITRGVFSEEGYDFFPSEYLNRTCLVSNSDPYKSEAHSMNNKPEVCLHNDRGFGCQTVYEEIGVIKRNKKKRDCWDYSKQLVAVGCKCNIRFSYN